MTIKLESLAIRTEARKIKQDDRYGKRRMSGRFTIP